jgi:hypothetical protein
MVSRKTNLFFNKMNWKFIIVVIGLILFWAIVIWAIPVITACRTRESTQVIWPAEPNTVSWTIPIKINGKFYNMQMRPSRTRRGVETNVYER